LIAELRCSESVKIESRTLRGVKMDRSNNSLSHHTSARNRNRLQLRRWLFVGLLFGVALAVMALSPFRFLTRSSAQQPASELKQAKIPKNMDVRVNGSGAAAQLARASSPAIVRRAQTQLLAVNKGLSRLKATVPNADARLSPMTGAVESCAAPTP
jgi:hypothetical protein